MRGERKALMAASHLCLKRGNIGSTIASAPFTDTRIHGFTELRRYGITEPRNHGIAEANCCAMDLWIHESKDTWSVD